MTEKRDAYVQKLKAKMDEWNADIDKLAAKADQANAETKIKYHKQLEDLRAKRKDLEDKIAEVQQASESAWEDLKQGIENSWEILKASFRKSKSEFERGYRQERDE
jgi:predicted  nucleic acid-binding Zn-ribbon protein